MKRAAAKIVPKLLNFEQKQRRMDLTKAMLTTFNDYQDFLKKAITGEESWMYARQVRLSSIPMAWCTIHSFFFFFFQ